MTLGVAVIGWLLYAWYRRRDRRRADLAETLHALGEVDLEVRRLAAAHRALTAADFTALEALLPRVERAAVRCGRGRRLRVLQGDLAGVADAIARYMTTATASCADVADAYCDAAAVDEVPAGLELSAFVRAAQQQVRLGGQLAAVVHLCEFPTLRSV
ncbi:hypothetical protein ACIPSJ_27300 [Streptomyces sp. NPDC090088]|uniref:hypothetical protein n=1 Tax=Streptomyces sp. NPDC090088 TaxID=3365944 RepID=UPI00380C3541